MADLCFATLHRAVTVAKDRQILSARGLKAALLEEGYDKDDIGVALEFWGAYEKDKQTGGAQAA